MKFKKILFAFLLFSVSVTFCQFMSLFVIFKLKKKVKDYSFANPAPHLPQPFEKFPDLYNTEKLETDTLRARDRRKTDTFQDIDLKNHNTITLA